MQIPKILYKYESINSYSLINLKAQAVYMASPLVFNDPYDCALSTGISEISDTDLDRLVSFYVNHEKISASEKQQFLSSSKADLRAMFFRTSKTVIEKNMQQFLEVRGVSCFSERKDILLMWAHYGGCYRGFCLEFSTDFDIFHNFRKVHYTSKIPRMDMVSFLVDNDIKQVGDLYCTKSINWKYEQEWRLIHSKAGTSYIYPPESLKAIYFGPNIDDHIKEIICLIIQGQNPDVEFWNGRLSKSKFKVEFDRFDYISYVAAKNMEGNNHGDDSLS